MNGLAIGGLGAIELLIILVVLGVPVVVLVGLAVVVVRRSGRSG